MRIMLCIQPNTQRLQSTATCADPGDDYWDDNCWDYKEAEDEDEPSAEEELSQEENEPTKFHNLLEQDGDNDLPE